MFANTTRIALSGLQAASQQMATAAHNIANADTPGFQRQRALQQALPNGGVASTVQTQAVPGAALASDVVDQLAAKNAFLANLAVFRTERKATGSLLDLST